MRTLLSHLKCDEGIVFLAPVLYGLLIGSVAVGTVTTVETVKNTKMVVEANKELSDQMTMVAERTEGKTDPRSVETNQQAKKLRDIAGELRREEDYAGTIQVGKELGNMAINMGSAVVGGGAAVRMGGKVIWQNLGAIGDSSRLPPLDDSTRDYIDKLNSERFRVTTREMDAGGKTGLTPIPATPLEGAIAETKLDAAQRDIARVTGGKFGDSRKLAEEVTLDAERNLPPIKFDLPLDEYGDEAKDRETWELLQELPDFRDMGGLPDEVVADRTPDRAEYDAARDAAVTPLLETLGDSLDKVDPGKASGEKGEIVLSPEDEKALKAGDTKTAIGTFISPMGPQPVIVNAGKDGEFIGTFPTLKSAPSIKSGASFQLPKKAWQSWWDGSRGSCPFLYAFDGERMTAVNDIISVSRDPKREYVDSMLFDGKPNPDGTLEVRVREIRAEESFIDYVRLRALDVPDGFEVALSPGGTPFSVKDASPPSAATGVLPAALALADGEGFAAYDGRALTAEFIASGSGAVLRMTVDGFENDGSESRFTPKRPAVRVEAFADGAWRPVGEAHPRDLADTTAFDVAPFVRAGRVRVRVTGVSCDTSVHQLVDRLALSSAPSGLASARDLVPSVSGPVPDAAALVLARDGKRVHLTPAQELRFVLPDPGADAYVIESVGWYREIGADGR